MEKAKSCKTVADLIDHLNTFSPDMEVKIHGVNRRWECEGLTFPLVFEEDHVVYVMDRNQPDLIGEDV